MQNPRQVGTRRPHRPPRPDVLSLSRNFSEVGGRGANAHRGMLTHTIAARWAKSLETLEVAPTTQDTSLDLRWWHLDLKAGRAQFQLSSPPLFSKTMITCVQQASRPSFCSPK